MKGIHRKTVFYISCACQLLVILTLILMYYRNVEGSEQIYRFKCNEEYPFHYHSKRFTRLNLDIKNVPYEKYTGKKKLMRGMIVYCTFRDIHGYHQIDSISTKRPHRGEPFMKTRVQSVSDETIRLEINFNRYPLSRDRLQRDAVSKARRRIVRDGTVVILDARISKRGTVYARNLYAGDMLIENYIHKYIW